MNIKLLLLGLPLLSISCALPGGEASEPPTHPENLAAWTYVPDLPITPPPYRQVHASWKLRLEVAYVYFEHHGSYNATGALIPALHRELVAQGLEPDGPPFALFYDNPAQVPVQDLYSRACIPVRGARTVSAPLHYDHVPSETCGYAFVSGNYPDAPQAYPGIFNYIQGMGWQPARDASGHHLPIREIYLVPPGSNPDPTSLVCEIQIPARPVE